MLSDQASLAAVEPHRRAIVAHAAVVRSLSTMTSVEDVLRATAAELCSLVGATRCSVYLKDVDTGVFRGCVGQASTDIDGRVRQLIAGVEADRFTREIVETAQPVLVSDARMDPRPVRSTVRAWDIRSMLGLPLFRDNEVIGLAFVDDEGGTHRFTGADLEAAAAFGQLAGSAIAQALTTVGARADLRAATRQIQLLRRAAGLDERLTRLAVDGGGLEEVLSVVAERTGKPVAVLDEASRVLAVAPSSDTGAFLRTEIERWDPVGLRDELDRVADETVVAGPYPEQGIHHRFMFGAVRAREQSLGHVIMAEVGADAHRVGPPRCASLRGDGRARAVRATARRRCRARQPRCAAVRSAARRPRRGLAAASRRRARHRPQRTPRRLPGRRPDTRGPAPGQPLSLRRSPDSWA